MKQEAIDKINRIKALLEERQRVESELEALLGIEQEAQPVLAVQNKGGREKGARPKCSQCGKIGHDITKCPEARGKHPNNPAEKPAAAAPSKRAEASAGKPCCRSLGKRHKSGCPQVNSHGDLRPEARLEAENDSGLSEEVKERIRDMRDRDMTTSEIAEELAPELDMDQGELEKAVAKVMSRGSKSAADLSTATTKSSVVARPLTRDEFDDLVYLKDIGDLSTMNFAKSNGVELAEVNRAAQARSYGHYLNSR